MWAEQGDDGRITMIKANAGYTEEAMTRTTTRKRGRQTRDYDGGAHYNQMNTEKKAEVHDGRDWGLVRADR